MNEEKVEWVKRMWHIVNNDNLNEGTRWLATDFLWKLVEVKEITCWLQQNVTELFEISMNMWGYINNEDPNEDHVHAWMSGKNYFWRQCWDVLLFNVGRKRTFSVVLEVLPTYLRAPEWQKKYRAFIVLAQSIEDCSETWVMIENLERVVQMVCSPFPNAHRHVRSAAIGAIQRLLKHLLRFRLDEEIQVMRTKFEPVMSKLLSSLQDDDVAVQNASIRAIETLAPTLGEVGFHLVLPGLAKVMNGSPNQDMRASAASIILDFNEYFTRDNLREHFNEIIRSCLIVSKKVKEFVRRIRFAKRREMRSWHDSLSEAWVQLWQNEERDFSPYLEILMSPVFSTAAQPDPNVPWYDRVDIIEQNAMACHMLCFCVDELMELLCPLIGQVVDTLIPFLNWYHDPPVADALGPSAKATIIAAASAMPKMLNSARKVVESSDPEDYDHAMQYVKELSDMVIDALNEALDVGPDEDVRYNIMDALDECVL